MVHQKWLQPPSPSLTDNPLGLVLAIRYDSSRFTRDLDFSTTEQYQADTADQLPW